MTVEYEDMLESMCGDNPPITAALDAGADAMSFVLNLHKMFKENGADLPDEPDIRRLEQIIDGVHGELAAACLFLSEKSFEQVPTMLRGIAKRVEKLDTKFKDPSGVEDTSVPKPIIDGFQHLADRIEATRVQQHQMLGLLKKNETP